MDEPKLSPIGEIVLAALTDLEKHLETHQCSTCVTKIQTFIKASTQWHLTQAQLQVEKGEDHGSEEKKTEEQSKESKEGESKKPSWDIFGSD